MPDREVAARLAELRRAGVDLELRLRGDQISAPDSEAYWRGQIDTWRASIESMLTQHPFQLRALQQPLSPADPDDAWDRTLLAELAELRTRLDAMVERLSRED